MPGLITLTRTAHSVLGAASDWKLTTKQPGGLQDHRSGDAARGRRRGRLVHCHAQRVDGGPGQTRFGSITLTQTGAGNHRVLHMPVTIVRGQEAVTLTKTCDPTALKAKGTTTCTVTAANPTFDKVTYAIKDTLPSQLKLDKGSVTGGTTSGSNTVVSSGTIAASDPADVHAENCGACSPFGYFPLSNFPSTIVVGDAGDETIDNFTVPTFSFAGETWDSVGIVSDGYAVVGGGTGQDVEFIDQVFPDEAPPNNVLAPFWSDLNATATFGGQEKINILSDGLNEWIVIEWTAVPEYSDHSHAHTMQIWIGLDNDADPG